MNLNFYKIASISKLILGLTIVIITYSYINIYEDPTVGISLGFIGTFITIRGGSFFLFFLGQKLFRKAELERITKDSYKLSLLFGIYCIINVLLLILGSWNKIWGFILLGGFILIQILLLENNTNNKDEE